ncbi:MAG: ABC transporter substrate-binding protein [Planctomycetota bacterium]|jgi:ABC-type transport system substrate-binding protein
MGGSIVLNLIRTTFAGIIAIVLWIVVAQRDAIEDRLRDVQNSQAAAQKREEKLGRQVKRLTDTVGRVDKRLQSLDRTVREGGVAIRGTGGSSGPPSAPGKGTEVDPRTLPHWETGDNILKDLSQEPRPPDDAPTGGTINFYVGSNLRSLNPYVNSDVDQMDRVVNYVYEYLADRSAGDDPDRWTPKLANRVTVSDDKKVFTIYLRKGVYWHQPVLTDAEAQGDFRWLADLPPQEASAHDAKFTFDIVRHPLSEASSEASYLEKIDTIDVVDRYTLRVTWKEASYYNLGSTIGLLRILPQHIFGRSVAGKQLEIDEAAQMLQQHWFNLRMAGTGPMKFVEFVSNGHIRLERNDDYWGIKPKIDELVLKIVENPGNRLSLFKTGELDLVKAEPSQWRAEYLEGAGAGSLKQMEADGKISLHKPIAYAYRYIGWNQKRVMFRDRKLRRALAHAFPKKRLVRDIEFGLARAHDAPVHPDAGYYIKDLEQFPFDLKKAAALLDDAGWKLNDRGVREKVLGGQKTELRFKILMYNGRPVYRQFGLMYAKELKKIGVIMELDLREWQKLTTELENKNFDVCSLGWGLSYDSDPSQIWHPREAERARSSNHIAYNSKELGETIDALRLEFDPAKRKVLLEKFQRIIVRDQPYLFLIVPVEPWFVSNRVGNQRFAPIRPQQYLLPWYVKEPE